ncbi:MAG: translation elongation factor Ts [Chloroflexi bacterium]|nr:MAG: translation elongation factor Ts [Chloroflexota bacterium]
MNITAEMVKELRDRTQAGILDCKKALEETNGDFDKAVELLRQKGLAVAEKKAGREANEGLIESYIHAGGSVGAIIELNCETDFVARTEAFKSLAHDLAMQVVATNPKFLSQDEIPDDFRERRLAAYRLQALEEGKPEHIADRIAEGRWNKYLTEIVLLKQPFIKDGDKTVEELITEKVAELKENIVLRRFARFELGEATDEQ